MHTNDINKDTSIVYWYLFIKISVVHTNDINKDTSKKLTKTQVEDTNAINRYQWWILVIPTHILRVYTSRRPTEEDTSDAYYSAA